MRCGAVSLVDCMRDCPESGGVKDHIGWLSLVGTFASPSVRAMRVVAK